MLPKVHSDNNRIYNWLLLRREEEKMCIYVSVTCLYALLSKKYKNKTITYLSSWTDYATAANPPL